MLKQVLIVVAVAVITKNVLQKIHDYYYPQEINSIAPAEIKDKVFTLEELKASKENGKLFLAVLGKVYDVSSGMKHYGNGGSYDFFVGQLIKTLKCTSYF
jgi:cytochrome b involved in lipid metabolism